MRPFLRWVLVEAGVTNGRKLTSWPTLQTDTRNAGGNWVDDTSSVSRRRSNTLAKCDPRQARVRSHLRMQQMSELPHTVRQTRRGP